MGATMEEIVDQVIEKNGGRMLAVGVDGSILKRGADVQARYLGMSYRTGVIYTIHANASASIQYQDGEVVCVSIVTQLLVTLSHTLSYVTGEESGRPFDPSPPFLSEETQGFG